MLVLHIIRPLDIGYSSADLGFIAILLLLSSIICQLLELNQNQPHARK